MTSTEPPFADGFDKQVEQALFRARRSCLTCEAFCEKTETCDHAPGQRPPARIIAYGCPLWDGGPPF